MNAESKKPASSSKVNNDLRLPFARVKAIMKTSPQIEAISQDCLYLVTKATEEFIKDWTVQAHSKLNTSKVLEYKHLAEFIQSYSKLEFMHDIVPRKITYKQFKKMMAAKESESLSSSSEDVDYNRVTESMASAKSNKNETSLSSSSESSVPESMASAKSNKNKTSFSSSSESSVPEIMASAKSNKNETSSSNSFDDDSVTESTASAKSNKNETSSSNSFDDDSVTESTASIKSSINETSSSSKSESKWSTSESD